MAKKTSCLLRAALVCGVLVASLGSALGQTPATNTAAAAGAPKAAATNAPAAPPPATTNAPPAAPATNAVVAAPAPAESNIRFQFEGMPYADVITRFSQMTGKPLIAETNLEGTLTFIDPKPYAYGEALDTLNLILSTKKVMLVESGHFLHLVPFKEIPQMPLPIFRGLDQTGDVRPGAIVTVVLQLKNLDAAESAQALTPMLSSAGSLAPLTKGRGLILTDRLDNIRRIQKLLVQIDDESIAQRQMKTHTLLHASGAVVADLLNRTFGIATAPKRTIFNEKSGKFDELTPDPNEFVTAVFDEASRTLVLFGPRDRVTMAEELIQRFEDKEGAHAGEVRIYHPRITRVDELALMIRQAVAGVAAPDEPLATSATKARVIVDTPRNRLIVTAPIAGQLDAIEKVIQQVDGTSSTAAPGTLQVQVTKLFPVPALDLANTAQVISNAVAIRTPSGTVIPKVTISVVPESQSLIVSGSAADLQEVAALLTQLETASSGQAAMTTRFVEIGSVAEAKRLAPLLEQLYRNQLGPGASSRTATAKITADDTAGRLIVSASPAHQELIEGLAKQLQSKPSPGKARRLEILSLAHQPVESLMTNLRSLVTERMSDPAFQDMAPPALLPDPAGNRLLVTGTETQIQAVGEILRQLDGTADQLRREMEVVALKYKKTDELIALAAPLLEQLQQEPATAKFPPRLMPDASGKRLILLALPADLKRIRAFIEQLDSAGPAAPRKIQAAKLYRRKAAEFAPLVDQLYREQLKGLPDPAGGPASILPETKPNRLMISGSDEEIARVEAIIRQLDPADAEGTREETRIVRLKTATAAELSTLVEQSLNAQSVQIKLLVDPRSNSLVVTGEKAAVDAAAQMIQQLDTNPYLQPREVRILELKSASADTVAPMVSNLLAEWVRDQRGPTYVSPTKVLPDAAGNRLIASGTRDELDHVASLVEKLDHIPEQAGGSRVFPLQSAEAVVLAPIVSNAMVRFDAQSRPISRVTVSADQDSNSLIVAGPRTDVQEASAIIEKLDGQARPKTRSFKVVNLTSEQAATVATLATSFFTSRNQSGSPAAQVSITPDPSGRRVIILAPEFLMPQVEEIVTALDRRPEDPERQVHLVDLKASKAADIFPTVNQLYAEQAKGQAARSATIVITGPENRLTVIGTAQQAQAVQSIVQTLEKDVPSPLFETKIYDLGRLAEAQRVIPLVEQLYRNQLKNEVNAGPLDAQFMGDGKSGRIYVTARPNQLQRIQTILQDLGAASGRVEPLETKVYELNTASATELAALVQKIYDEQLASRPTATGPRPLILPDPAANRLVTAGIQSELAEVDKIIKQLDQVSTRTAGTRIFKLKRSEADQIATILSTALSQQLPNGQSIPRVSVGADKKSNTLIVSGDPKDIQSASVIIEQLDTSVQKEPRRLQLITIKTGSATNLAARVKELYIDHLKGLPEAAPADALILGDESSNRLIVNASQSQLEIIQAIAAQLDATTDGAGRQVRVLNLRHSSASALASIANQLFARQLASTDPSQRLVITPAPDDRSLVLDAVNPALQQIEKLVELLDAPDPGTNVVIRTVQLARAQAASIADAINQSIAARYPASTPRRTLATPVAGANSLLLRGPSEDINEAIKVIRELDQEGQSTGTEVRIYKLENGEVKEVSGILRQLLQNLDSNRARLQPAANIPPATVLEDLRSNSLIVSGAESHFQFVEKTLPLLDNVPARRERDVKFIWLQNARAEQVAGKVEAIFADRPRTERPSIDWDMFSNLVTVVGKRADIAEVEALIQQLDQMALDYTLEVRLVPVADVPVEQMARMLQNIYPQMTRGSIRIVDQLEPLPGPTSRTNAPGTITPPGATVPRPPAPGTNQPPEVVIAIDRDANALMLSGPAHELDRIAGIVSELSGRTLSGDSEFRQFTIKEADPVMVARTLTELFKEAPVTVQQPGQQPRNVTPAPKFTVVAEARTRSIIVRARPADFVLLESLIRQLDAQGLSSQLEFRLLPLTNSAPEKILPMVNQMVTQLNLIRPGEPLSVAADPRSRGLLVVSRDTVLEMVERLVRSLDTPGANAEAEVLIRSLKKASAAQMTLVLQSMLRPGTTGELTPEARELQDQIRRLNIRNAAGQTVMLDLSKPIKILPDPLQVGQNGGNRLILTSTADNLLALSAVVDMLDQVPLIEGVNVRMLRLKNADAAAVSQTLTTVFQQGLQLATGPGGKSEPEGNAGKALVHPLHLAVDARSNTLVLSGQSETLELAERLAWDLDKEADGLFTDVKLFPLKFTTATRLVPMLQSVFAETSAAPATEGTGTQVTRLRSEAKVGDPKTSQRPKTRPALVVQADDLSNTLVVAARQDVMPLIEEVIRNMDVPSASGVDTLRVYGLQHAPAASIQRVVADLFDPTKVPQLRPEDRPRVTIDERSNALIISGSQKAFAIIDSLITQLDTKEVLEKTNFRVFSLKQATAAKVQDTLQKLFNQRTPRVAGQLPQPITVLADSWSNSLIVGASPEDLAMAQTLIERLDGAGNTADLEIEILPLVKADARRVAETIQGLYKDGTTGAALPVTINVDERLNALVISAGETDRKRIAELVKKLDTDMVARVSEIRVMPLHNARADALAIILNTALNTSQAAQASTSPSTQSLLQFITQTKDGKELITSALKEHVLITPDSRMNSLIVSAPLDYMQLLEQIIGHLDTQAPQLAKIKVFVLENADARQMADLLETMFRRHPAPSLTASQRVVQYTLVKPENDPDNPTPKEVEGEQATIGNAEDAALTVTIDPRTNSILIGGTEHYVALAGDIIKTLDSSPAQERISEVYRLRNAKATEVQTAVRSFLDQDRQRVAQVLGTDAMGTAQRMLEREVAIVAEPISNTLLISANPRHFTKVMDLIDSLDKPQAQVLIQALIAEVLIDNTTELGIEWAYTGQDGSKTFSAGTDFGVAQALSSFGGFSSAIMGSDYSFLIRALQSDGRLHVLSRPQILTADNQAATINVGQRVPLIVNSQVTENGNTINSFTYQNVGVILSVTPRISPDGFVKMDVGTTNSALSSSTVDVSDTFQVPIINERLATTTVSVQSGQSIIIGGLISTSEDVRSKRIPWLGNIPLLGVLFRSTSNFKDRKELLIFLTPQILTNPTNAITMTRHQLERSSVKEQLEKDLRERDLLFLEPTQLDPTQAPNEQ